MKRNLVYLALILACACVFGLGLLIEGGGKDTQPPVISFSEETPEFSVQDPKDALLLGVTARDAADGDVTDSLVVAAIQLSGENGTVDVTYAAFDGAGNVAKAVRQVRFADYRSPRFSVNRSLTFAGNTNFDIFAMVGAQDLLDGDISHRVRITSLDGTSVSAVGLHQVELKVSNSLGETVCLVIPVEVYAAGTYDATVTLTDYLIYLPKDAQFVPETYLVAYKGSGAEVSLANGLPEGFSLDMISDVKPGVPGVYTVEYRVTQTVGTEENAQSHVGYAKLIVVVEG